MGDSPASSLPFWRRLTGGAEDYRLASWLFLRLLGATYLVAFVSLWVQVDGLVGSGGILPAAEFLRAVGERLGPERFWLAPTVFWLGASDAALHAACAGGAVAALLLVADLAPAGAAALAWALYLSLTVVGRDFLSFQWDALLLEAGLLGVLLAPPRWRGDLGPPPAPPRAVLWLFWWLLFRLMFSSGVVKLVSGDPTWRHLTALTYHYQTQPLPNVVAYFAHHLPGWFQTASTLAMFAVELLAPWLIFCGRRLRLAGAAALVGLQAVITATGNYAFFNLLSVALCVLLLDDRSWPRRLRRWVLGREAAAAVGEGRAAEPAPVPAGGAKEPAGEAPEEAGGGGAQASPSRRWPAWVVAPAAAVLLLLSTLEMLLTVGLAPASLLAPLRWVSPLRGVNGYGLFAVMTTTRDEIVVEGSRDGETWRPYEFRYKPGDLARRPSFVAPHQPRLDWQMWFAALGSCRSNPWFVAFLGRLLEGSPEVLDLLADNPFPDGPPRYVRSTLYDYRFTDLRTLRREGRWWQREELGPYCPTFTRR
jgi:lipase maturation factor 1